MRTNDFIDYLNGYDDSLDSDTKRAYRRVVKVIKDKQIEALNEYISDNLDKMYSNIQRYIDEVLPDAHELETLVPGYDSDMCSDEYNLIVADLDGSRYAIIKNYLSNALQSCALGTSEETAAMYFTGIVDESSYGK